MTKSNKAWRDDAKYLRRKQEAAFAQISAVSAVAYMLGANGKQYDAKMRDKAMEAVEKIITQVYERGQRNSALSNPNP